MQRVTFIVLLLLACLVSLGRSNKTSVLSRLPRSRSPPHREKRSQSSSCCPDGWMFHGESCYLFADTNPVSFTEAEHYCQRHGGHLVRIDDWSENSFLKSFLRRINAHNHWIGLDDETSEGEWEWTNGGSTAYFTDWCPGNPNNAWGRQDCAYFRFHSWCNGRWDDDYCNSHHLPLCEKSI